MNKMSHVLVIIPAKAVSKRLPGKNLKNLRGKPMLSYAIETAKSAKGVARVIVSTESEEIKKIAEQYGAEVPFIRPIELTADEITTLQVMQHALSWLKENERYEPDYVMVLYPTSPLLKRERVEQAIAIALEKGADSVISGHYDKGHYWVEGNNGWKRLYPTELVNSQYQKPLFVENGAIYLSKLSVLKTQLVANQTQVLLMEDGENVDVDYPEDFEKVECLMRSQIG
jgi:CMP-N-acetylneuraminic acid synthetase